MPSLNWVFLCEMNLFFKNRLFHFEHSVHTYAYILHVYLLVFSMSETHVFQKFSPSKRDCWCQQCFKMFEKKLQIFCIKQKRRKNLPSTYLNKLDYMLSLLIWGDLSNVWKSTALCSFSDDVLCMSVSLRLKGKQHI